MNSDDDAKQMYMLIQRGLKFSMNKLAIDYLKTIDNNKGKSGNIKLRNLVNQGQAISSFDIKDKDIKLFEKYAKKYGISFSIVKNKLNDDKLPTFNVFFKAKDEDVIKLAFEKYCKAKLKVAGKEEKDLFNLEKLNEIKQEVRATNVDKDKIKQKRQEQSL